MHHKKWWRLVSWIQSLLSSVLGRGITSGRRCSELNAWKCQAQLYCLCAKPWIAPTDGNIERKGLDITIFTIATVWEWSLRNYCAVSLCSFVPHSVSRHAGLGRSAALLLRAGVRTVCLTRSSLRLERRSAIQRFFRRYFLEGDTTC